MKCREAEDLLKAYGTSAEAFGLAVDALSTAAFDAADPVALDRFFRDLPTMDHVMVTAGRPYYGRLADMDFAKIRDVIGEHLLLALYVARNAASKVRPGGTLIFMGGTGGRRPAIGMSIASAGTAALPALTANLALEIAPVRVNLIAAGFVDTPLSAELLDAAGQQAARAELPKLEQALKALA